MWASGGAWRIPTDDRSLVQKLRPSDRRFWIIIRTRPAHAIENCGRVPRNLVVCTIKRPMRYASVFCTHIKLYRSLNFTWTEASCANINMLGCSVNYGFNTHNVGFEGSVASSVWVGHFVTESNTLTAYITFCHNWYTSWIFLTSLIVTYKFVKCKCFLNFSLKHNNRFTFWSSDIILNL